MENYKVYKHTFPNGKVYIGITKQKPNVRFKNGYGYQRNVLMWKAICKYNWNNVKHDIIFDGLTKEQAENKEIELIDFYKSNQAKYGYNIQNGGNCIGNVSEETKKKISIANKGKANKFKGIPRSEDVKQKISQANKGKTSWCKGKKMPKEFGKKISQRQKGKIRQHDGGRPKKKVLCIETNTIYESMHDAYQKTGIFYKNISAVCNGKRNVAGGYHWKIFMEG